VRVQVTFLAPLRYQLGASAYEFVDARDELASDEFLAELRLRLPRLERACGEGVRGCDQGGWTVVVNEELQRGAFVVRGGDRVRILGPLSGG
jgi:molybdopterin converting factor small subunit